jgi:hypothetical protein
MRLRIRLTALLAALALALAASLNAEVLFKALSVTDASQTYVLSKPSAGVMLCNEGANTAYYRLFNETDTPSAATTAYLPLLASKCLGHGKPPTSPANYSAVSVIAGSGLTTTVNLYFE